MKNLLLVLLLIAGVGAVGRESLFADNLSSPFDPHLAYSADLVFTNGQGIKMQELYCDNGKVRLERTEDGKSTVTIIRPDVQKFYFVVLGEKIVVSVPYDPNEFKNQIFAATGAQGSYQQIGAETTEGVNCIKYRGTAGADDAVYYAWIDAATKAPVKLAREDGSFAVVWKNFKPGPQNGVLFEPPADYKMVTPNLPAGGPGQ